MPQCDMPLPACPCSACMCMDARVYCARTCLQYRVHGRLILLEIVNDRHVAGSSRERPSHNRPMQHLRDALHISERYVRAQHSHCTQRVQGGWRTQKPRTRLLAARLETLEFSPAPAHEQPLSWRAEPCLALRRRRARARIVPSVLTDVRVVGRTTPSNHRVHQGEKAVHCACRRGAGIAPAPSPRLTPCGT